MRRHAPYSQVLAVLAARLARDHGLASQQKLLQFAAIVVTDRSVLKEIMLSTFRAQRPPVPRAVPVLASDDRTDIADEVMKDLKELKHLKKKFESLYVDAAGEMAIEPETKKTRRSRTPKTRKTEDPIIEEIKNRKELGPVSEKQKEQLEVIDQFIKKKPTIKRTKSRRTRATAPAPKPEKAPTEEQLEEFGDGVISETLVDILIRQEKKDKAIEVLKKLIWKFPQKKAYFAARIEELKQA